jgi:hypothetical protein
MERSRRQPRTEINVKMKFEKMKAMNTENGE